MRRAYWRRVFDESLHPVERTEIVVTALFALVGLAGVLLGVGIDQHPLTVGSTVMLILAVGYSLVTTPARLDAGLRARVDALESTPALRGFDDLVRCIADLERTAKDYLRDRQVFLEFRDEDGWTPEELRPVLDKTRRSRVALRDEINRFAVQRKIAAPATSMISQRLNLHESLIFGVYLAEPDEEHDRDPSSEDVRKWTEEALNYVEEFRP